MDAEKVEMSQDSHGILAKSYVDGNQPVVAPQKKNADRCGWREENEEAKEEEKKNLSMQNGSAS